MDKELRVIHTQTFDRKPLAIIRNLPGGDADMTPAQMRALATTLMNVAEECERQPMGQRNLLRAERNYPITT